MPWRVTATLVLTAWGALAFGAAYPWAFVSLLAGCAVVWTAAFAQRDGRGKTDVALAVSLALLVAAVGARLVPLSFGTIHWLSPETDVALRRYAVGYPATTERHALSIEPRTTTLALAAS